MIIYLGTEHGVINSNDVMVIHIHIYREYHMNKGHRLSEC